MCFSQHVSTLYGIETSFSTQSPIKLLVQKFAAGCLPTKAVLLKRRRTTCFDQMLATERGLNENAAGVRKRPVVATVSN